MNTRERFHATMNFERIGDDWEAVNRFGGKRGPSKGDIAPIKATIRYVSSTNHKC